MIAALRRPTVIALSAIAVCLLVGACASPPPPSSLEEVYQRAYNAFETGELDLAQQLTTEGQLRASEPDDPGPQLWDAAFRVLSAEILTRRRQDAEALELLADFAHPGTLASSEAVRIRALMTLGLLHCRSSQAGSFDRGWDYLDTAEHAAVDASLKVLQGEVYLRRGTCHFLRGRLSEAESYFTRTLNIAEQHQAAHLETNAAGSLGLVAIQSRRFDEATDWLQRALDTAESIGAHIAAAKTVANLGWCYLELGDYERALTLLRRAEALETELGLRKDLLTNHNNIGRAYFELGRLSEADEQYRKALELADELGNDEIRLNMLLNRAMIAFDQERFEQAESLVDSALELETERGKLAYRQHALLLKSQIYAALARTEEAERLRKEVIASEHTRSDLRWEAHGALAQLYAWTDRPQLAEQELQTAFRLVNAPGHRPRKLSHRLSFFSSLKDLYDIAVIFYVDAGRPEKALQVAMESRARLIRESLEGVGRPVEPPDLDELRNLARESETAFLTYWTGAKRSFLWLIHADGIEFRTLPDQRELSRMIAGYQRRILQSDDPLTEPTGAGQTLWTTLVGPVSELLPQGSRVVLAADGPLHQLSFETLIVPADAAGDARYWIEDVTLALTPSLSLLDPSRRSDSGPQEDSILLIGDPLPAGEEFPRLAHANREILRIAELFDPSRRIVFSGPEASPSALMESEPERFAFIHVAAHVTANRERPLESAVILSPRDGSHKLYARDVLSIPLDTRLVTLSACRSAGARAFAGEGLVGLAWAFMSAGAQNVVGGLWDVEDASTSELMESFYRELRAGRDPAAALREAKLGLLESSSAYRKPYYWAPFAVYRGPSGL